MSRNYFILKLDTTGPRIEIHAPSYTIFDIPNYIEIIADEELDSWQDIYIVDAKGNRFPLIFSQTERNKFVGTVVFPTNFVPGIATIFARLRDKVWNISQTATKTIKISSGLRLKIDAVEAPKLRTINSITKIRAINTNEVAKVRAIASVAKTKAIEINQEPKVKHIKVGD